ncbi:MAG TPA: glycosyltransferase family 1 protein [Gemmatimonadaceae bacterium]
MAVQRAMNESARDLDEAVLAPMGGGGDRLRIAICTDTFVPQLNGVARTLFRLCEALRDRGCAVRVFAPSDPSAPSLPNVRRYASVPFWGYPELRLALPGVSAMRKALTNWRANLVHAATPFGVGYAGRAAARLLGIPFVTSYHTSLAAYARFYGLGALSRPGWHYLRWFHNGGARTFVPTRAIRDELAERGFERLAIWGRGVDAANFHPRWRSVELRRELGASEDTVLVGYVGRLAIEKGVDTLVDAMRLVRSAAPSVRFALAGDGPAADRCRARAPHDVTFLGRIEGARLSAFYASCDVLVFPSHTDTFGNVLLEAMASRLAIIAADTPATREVLDGNAGVTFPPDDAPVLAARILALASTPLQRHALAQSALAAARRRSWDDVFDELLAAYESVRDSHRASEWSEKARRRGKASRFAQPAPIPSD